MTRMARILVMAAGLGLPGCNLVSSESDRLSVQIHIEIAGGAPSAAPPVIQRALTTVQVSHQVTTPTTCYDFVASGTQNGTVVEFVLTGTGHTGGAECTATPTVWNYAATITGLQGTVDRVAITYNLPGGGRTEYPIP